MKTSTLIIGIVLICLSADVDAVIEAIKNTGEDVSKSLWDGWVKTLDQFGPKRNVIIEINNELDKSINGGQIFLQWGKQVKSPPTVIGSRAKESILFEKKEGLPSGTAGILAYNIGTESDPARIAIVFSVPWLYATSSNWFGLQFISDSDAIDKYLYTRIYYNPKWSTHEAKRKYAYAKDKEALEVVHNDYIVKAQMSDEGRAILKVDIMKRSRSG